MLPPQITTEAQHQPDFCAFYEECGENPSVEGALIKPIIPCLDYSPARPLQGYHYQELKRVCPMLDQGIGKTKACCSLNQLTSLSKSLELSKAVLNRCPSCADNFAHVHCINTCSPNQSQLLNITRTMNVTIVTPTLGGTPVNVTREAVLGYQSFLSQTFADDAFKSCKNVRIPATGGYAIATMCGRYGATLCTPQRWYDFQGDSSNGLAPLDVEFNLVPEGQSAPPGMIVYNGKALACNEVTPTGGEACSCQDCEESCPALPPLPELPTPFEIGQLDGVMVICLIVFCCISVLFLTFLMIKCIRQSSRKGAKGSEKGAHKKDKNANEVKEGHPIIDPKDVSCTDRNSLVMQEFLGSFFRVWGSMIARNPFKVLLVCLVMVVVLGSGMHKIELTTDPVQLWSSPTSRARREKDFHDAHFDPFFRTNQLILTAPGYPGHIYDSLVFGKQNFSGILSKGNQCSSHMEVLSKNKRPNIIISGPDKSLILCIILANYSMLVFWKD